MILTAFKFVLVLCTVAADAFFLLSMLAAYRFFRRRESPSRPETYPPVSILIPLRGADFKAYQNYAGFCQQDYPEYQLVFGVHDRSDSSIPIVEKLAADFSTRDIEVVICSEAHGQNAKVSNLQNMLRAAKYEHVIIVDSDIRVQRNYLKAVLAPLEDPKVGLVTCFYRAAEAPDFGARLEAVGITGEFAAGVLMAWMLEGVKFALGSTMATTKSRLVEIGGFQALADYLADDFMLGNLIAGRGYEVRLSHHVVETAMPPIGLAGMIRHQLRWARSTRISRPLGYLGLVLTYGTALSALNLIVSLGSTVSLALFAATLGVRMSMAWVIGVRCLKDRILRVNFWLVPARDVLSFGIWLVSWFGRRVEWRGRLFEVSRDGKMVLAD